MASTEDFWKKRQANGAAIDVWLLNRCGALWQLFQPPCNSGTLETLVQGETVRKNKEKKEELDLGGEGEVVGRDWGEVKEREEEVVKGRGGGIRKYGRG